MDLLYSLLVAAIVIPVLALFGHLYVAYKYAPDRAKSAVLDALVGDEDFQTDLIKTLLNNLFKEIPEGDKKVIPIDAIIARAEKSFSNWIKQGIPKDLGQLAEVMPMDDYGNPDPQAMQQAAIMNALPKNVKKYLPLLQYIMRK